MAVEIRQLVIKCEVTSMPPAPPPPRQTALSMRRELLDAVDERINELLRRAKER